jgi:PAS domain-containing protein
MTDIAQLMKDNLRSAGDQAEARANEFPADELFAAASTAVLVADQTTGRIIAVNPAAQLLLGLPAADLVGDPWHKAFDSPGEQELKAAAAQASAQGAVLRVSVSTYGAVGALTAAISTFFVRKVSYLLVHLEPLHKTGRNSQVVSGDLFDELDDIPMGFVVTDGALCVEFGNRAFVELTGSLSRDSIEGQNLLRWLDLTQDELDLMCRQMQLRQAATVMRASLSTQYGRGPTVEVTAVAVPNATNPYWGFVLRQAGPQPLASRSLRKHS